MNLFRDCDVPVNVLVVDDEDYITDVLATGLRFLDFDVSVARNGLDAIAKVIDLRPDIMLLDVAMPGCDGFEVCRRLRNDGVQVPIILSRSRSGSRRSSPASRPYSVAAVANHDGSRGSSSVISCSTTRRTRCGEATTASTSRPPSTACCVI